MRPHEIDMLKEKLLRLLDDPEDKKNLHRIVKVVALAVFCPITSDVAIEILSGDLDTQGSVNARFN